MHSQKPDVYVHPRTDLVGWFDGAEGELVFHPQTPFRCESLWVLGGSGAGWLLQSVRVGVREQLATVTPASAALDLVAFQRFVCATCEPGTEIRVRLKRYGAVGRIGILLCGLYV